MKPTNHRPSRPIRIFLVCFFIIISSTAYAENLTFSWTANPEPVSGYNLYYKTGDNSGDPYNGTGLDKGSSPIDVGKVTQITVAGRDTTSTYHFVLTAYNSYGESGYTVPVTVGPLDGSAPTINVIRIQ